MIFEPSLISLGILYLLVLLLQALQTTLFEMNIPVMRDETVKTINKLRFY